MRVSDYIAEFIASRGIHTVYEMTGGMITQLLDSLHHRDDITIVSVHHEQSAAFAAEGMARMTGIPGVALATSGPGATNLITGIASCYFDSVPVLFITGQVNTNELRADSGVRQAGFQEADIVAMTRPITKGAWLVTDPADVPRLLTEAYALSLEGRPGPVLLDIPMDVQRATIEASIASVPPVHTQDRAGVEEVLSQLAAATRPLVLAGGGVRAAGAASELRAFVETCGVPVVSTLMGIDVLPHAHPQHVGFVGTYGNRWANLAMRDADLLLVLGARLDVRQTGADVADFAHGKQIIQVDIDPAQLAWRVAPDRSVCMDLSAFLSAARAIASAMHWPDLRGWRDTIESYAQMWPDLNEHSGEGLNPAEVMHALSAHAGAAAAFVSDVGQNQMWAAQSLRIEEGQRFLLSGGMGAMGFAIPTAIGAAQAVPDSPVVVVAGDGGLQVSIQELETIARLRLPIKIVVLNNNCLGMVRQFQDELFESRYQSTVWGYGTPDFVAVSKAYGVDARRIERASAIEQGMRWLMAAPAEPALLEVVIDPGTCARPKVPFGKSVYAMDPPNGGVIREQGAQ